MKFFTDGCKNPYIRAVGYAVVGSIAASALFLIIMNILSLLIRERMIMIGFTVRIFATGLIFSIFPVVLSCFVLVLVMRIPRLVKYFSRKRSFIVGALMGMCIALALIMIVLLYIRGRIEGLTLIFYTLILSLEGIGFGGTIARKIYTDNAGGDKTAHKWVGYRIG